MRSDSQRIRRGRPSAAGNAAISLISAVVPALVALFVIPMLLRTIGAELFGLLAFVWIVFGTFAVLDFGTGRATTKYVAEFLSRERTAAIPALFWSACAINLVVGSFCGVLLYALAPWLTAHVVKVPAALQPTCVLALRITACALPWIVLGGVFRSALEGLQRFDLSNAVQLPVGALNYVVPLIVARAGGTLPWVVGALCLTRISAVPALFLLCRRQLPQLGRPGIERRQLRRLASFGGWLTVSNVAGPILLSFDRLFVGSVLGARALGLYAPIYELVTRLSLVPASVMAALFPSFSTFRNRTADEIWWAMRRAQRLLALLMLPMMILGVSLAPIILEVWLGTAQAPSSIAAMQLLMIGLVALSVGAVPFTLVQALGEPRRSALIHVVELPIHAALTWWAVTRFGVMGAAAAWSLRALYDAALFDLAVARMIGRRTDAVDASFRTTASLTACAAILSAIVALAEIPPAALALAGILALSIVLVVAWRLALETAERQALLSGLRRIPLVGRRGGRGEPVSQPVGNQAERP